MTLNKIKFRPHHFLCAVGFQGKGYSRKFIKNFSEIVKQLRSADGDNTLLEVTAHTDDICSPCPHKRGLLCETQEKITQLDNLHAKALHLSPGERLTWGEAKQRIREHMDIDTFHQTCASCSWKAYGVCEDALKRLRGE